MANQFRKTVAMILTFVLFLSAIHIGPASAEESPATVPDGVYPIEFRYVQDKNPTQTSVSNSYMVPGTGKLIVQNGKAKFENEISKENYALFEYFGSRMAGRDKAVIQETVGQEPVIIGIEGYQPVATRLTDDGNHVIVQIEIAEIGKIQDILMHIHDKDNIYQLPQPYNYWYNVGLELDISGLPGTGGDGGDGGSGGDSTPVTLEMFNNLVTVARSVYESTYEGTGDGFYPVGSKTALYNSITTAESIAASAGGNQVLLKAAYDILNEALNYYQSLRIVVNKTSLIELIEQIRLFTETAKEGGTAEGGPGGSTTFAISDKEYAYPTVSSFVNRLAEASNVVADPNASPEDVANQYNLLYNGDSLRVGFKDIEKRQFLASTVRIMVLDTDTVTTTYSVYANEFKPTATILHQAEAPYYQAYANITFVNPAGELDVKRTNPNSAGYYTPTSFSLSGVPVRNSSDEHNKTYQVSIRYQTADDSKWRGLSGLRYTVNGVTKTVFISYNAEQLDALNASIDAAKQIYHTAVEGTAPGQYSAGSKAKLLQAIELAEVTGSNLAAPRPQIAAAATALQTAVEAFQATAARTVYFSAVHATKDAFSSMDNYFVKPAVVTTEEDGAVYASVTIKDSSRIPEFKVKQNGEFVEAALVSEDTAANTRVVKFKIDHLQELLDAKVRVVVPAQGYESTHDIRLNFNNVDNTALSQAIANATAVHRAAVAGTQPGQYPEAAKAALQSAIDAAGAEAARVTGTPEQTAAALLALQQALNTFKASVISSPGQYPIGFTIYKVNTNEPSVMYDYVDKTSGKLTLRDGKKYVSFTLNQSKEIVSFKTKLNADSPLIETTTINTDAAANQRTVEFEVEDLTKKVDGWVKIYWDLGPPIGIYDHEYEVQIGFSDLPAIPDPVNKTALNTLIADAQAKHAAAVEGTQVGQYPAGSKAKLLTAITAAQAVAADSAATQQQVNEAQNALQAAVTAFVNSVNTGGPVTVDKTVLNAAIADAQAKYDAAVEGTALGQYLAGAKNKFKKSLDAVKAVAANTQATQAQVDEAVKTLQAAVKLFSSAQYKDAVTQLPDGEYSLQFNIFTAGTEQLSAVQDYVDASSGKLLVEGGKKYVSFTLNRAKEVSSFQTKLNSTSALTEAEVVSKDDTADTKNIKFEVQDLSINKQYGLVKLLTSDAQEVNYDVQIGYGKIQLDLTKPVKDGQYHVSLAPRSDDPAAPPVIDYIVESRLNVQNGKKLATVKLKSGVTLYEILLLNADGTTNKVITPTYSAKASGLVRVLADEPAGQTVQFEAADDLTATYAFGVVKDGQDATIKVGFGAIEPVTSVSVITPTPDEPIAPVDSGSNDSGIIYPVGGSSGGAAVISTLQDGKYSVNYAIHNVGTDQKSILQNYVVTPALLTVSGNKKVVSVRLKQSNEIGSLKTELNGAWTDVKVIAEDQKNNTRDVQFEIKDLSSKLKISAKINSDEIQAEISFDAKNVQKVSDDAQLTGGQTTAEGQTPESKPTVQVLKDIENHWAQALIERAAGLGIVNGYEDGTFRPDGEISRAEFTVLISRALQLDKGGELNFADLDKVPDWAKSHLEKAVAAGFITSYEDHTFRPERSISRSEIAVIIARALDLPLDEAATAAFADAEQIPDWAYAHVAAASKKGIINGRDNHIFAPHANATRAEAVKLILSLLDEVK
ncbi:NEAT domain-containing protein [Paenibacillus naphthalenovorans]|uniref:NEAT domain-containing protein n=1 Tax=Paenibacillus naphthalenovorans TaxID=162209 RepID=UPI003D2E2A4D